MNTEFTLRFDTGNAAFDDGNGAHECARILRGIAERIERAAGNGANAGTVHDVNGNRIGQWSVDFPETDEDGEG